MSNVKVIHDTDLGASLEVVAGKLEASQTLATDAEVAAAIAAAQASAQADAASQIAANEAAENAEEAAASAAASVAKIRSNYLHNAQTHHSWSAVFEVNASVNGVKWFGGVHLTYPRMIIMGGGDGAQMGDTGFFNVLPPAPGTTVYGLGFPDSVVDANGFITMPNWGSLYYKIPQGGAESYSQGTFHVAAYEAGDYEVAEDMIYLGGFTHDSGLIFKRADGVKCSHGLTYPDTPWLDMTPYFAAGVANYGYEYQVCQFRRYNNNLEIRGLCEAGGTGFAGVGDTTLAVLPDGFRPTMRRLLVSSANGGGRRVDITSDGVITHVSSSSKITWVSLEFTVSLN